MSGPYVIQFSPSGQYWVEPAPGLHCGTWTSHRADATRYPRRDDVDRAAAAVRAKFQRHNRAGIKVQPLVPEAAPARAPKHPPSTEPDLFAGTI